MSGEGTRQITVATVVDYFLCTVIYPRVHAHEYVCRGEVEPKDEAGRGTERRRAGPDYDHHDSLVSYCSYNRRPDAICASRF